MYSVYMHINKINNKKYIGITKQKPEHRWGVNGSNYKDNKYFISAIKKYGWNNFEHIIVQSNLSCDEACELEKFLIKHHKTQHREFGYNILEGGTAPNIPTEIREKISKALTGNKNGLNHPCSDEKKQKISAAQKGRKLTKEHKQKLSKAAQQRHVPCSDAKKKVLSQNYPNKQQVYCLETDTVYESVQECARQLNLYATNVSKVCRSKIHSTGGYHFKYFNETINA